MVWLGLVMWPPRFCSISLCRSSPNQDGYCQGQISHICWIMVTTIDWAQLALVPTCACVLPIQHVCCGFLNDCAHELRLRARRVLCHSLHVSARQLVFVKPCKICSCFCFIVVSIPCRWSTIRPAFSQIADIPDEGGGDANCTDKSGKAWVSFCDAFPTKPPTTPRMPWQPFHIWLTTSPIVGPLCLWSFNNVCFYAHCADSCHGCCSCPNSAP